MRAAAAAFGELTVALGETIERMRAAGFDAGMHLVVHNEYRVIRGGRFNFIIRWRPDWGNQIGDALLSAEFTLGMPAGVIPGAHSFNEAQRLARLNYDFEPVSMDENAYISQVQPKRQFVPKLLADELVKQMLDLMERNRGRT